MNVTLAKYCLFFALLFTNLTRDIIESPFFTHCVLSCSGGNVMQHAEFARITRTLFSQSVQQYFVSVSRSELQYSSNSQQEPPAGEGTVHHLMLAHLVEVFDTESLLFLFFLLLGSVPVRTCFQMSDDSSNVSV